MTDHPSHKTSPPASGESGPPHDPESPARPPEAEDASGSADPAVAQDPSDPERRIAELEQQLAAAREDALRARAELENTRKRLQRTMEEERRFYPLPFVRDMIEVLDDLHRACQMAEKSPEAAAFAQGLRMVCDRFEQTLRKHHCLPIEAEGQAFDPHYHEAIGEHPTEEFPEGNVAHVARIGYTLHGRVVRPAQVLVAKKPQGDTEPSAEPDDGDAKRDA